MKNDYQNVYSEKEV